MPHYIFAILSILAAIICLSGAYRQYVSLNFRMAALLLVAGSFILRWFVASDQYLHEWDERYHALVAKHLMDNFLLPLLYKEPLLAYKYTDWSGNFVWLHKQPLPLWCMAISMKLFGVNELALRLPSVVLSSLSVYITYWIGKSLFGQKVGLLAAFFHAINGLMLEMTGGRIATDHIDIFFLFFVELAVVCAIMYGRKKQMLFNVLMGICVGCAVLCKWLPAFVVIPVWLIINFDEKNVAQMIVSLLVITVTSLVIFVPWQLYMHQKFPLEYANELLHNYRHITEVLDGRTGGPFYFVERLVVTLHEFFWVAFVWFCIRLYKKDNIMGRWALIIWAALPFIFFSIAKTKMQGYLLFAYPVFFIILSEFCLFLLEAHTNARVTVFKKLLFVTAIILSVRYSIERIKPFQDQSRQLLWANEFRAMDNNGGKKVYVNVKHNIEGMFYTNAIMYQWIPGNDEIDAMKAKGYEVIVNQNPDL